MTTYPYDYYALRGMDPADWSRDFFWGISREETTATVLDLKGFIHGMVEELGDTRAGDVVLIAGNVTILFGQVLVHLANIRRIQEKGLTVRHSEWMRLIPLLLRQDGPAGFRRDDMWSEAGQMSAVRSAKNLMLSLRYNAKAGKLNPFAHASFSRPAFAMYNDNVVFRPHTRTRGDWVRLTTPEEWLAPGLGREPASGDAAVYRAVAQKLCAFARTYAADRLGVPLPDRLADGLRSHAVETLLAADRAYGSVQARMRRLRPGCLLLPTGGKPLARAMALAGRHQGIPSIGFAHGYEICHLASPRMVYQELSTPDTFMSYFPGSCELFERVQDQVPPPRGHRTAIAHEENPALHDVWQRWRAVPARTPVRRVMVLEVSLSHEWAGYHLADSMVNYEFYYRLCKTLTGNGYEVVFKRRPKAPSWRDVDILSMPGVTVRHDPFESPQTLADIDAIILQYGWSSTLKYAACTNKQVIYVDAGWEPWYPDVYEAMARRCSVLRCRYDERNRCLYDEEELLGLLGSWDGRVDTAFMERYLFPKGALP